MAIRVSHIARTIKRGPTMTNTGAQARVPIHRLPLAKETMQGSLTQLDLADEPSAQRRNTAFPAATRGIWARNTPLWTEWPLRVTKSEALELGADVDKGDGVDIEDVLRRWDPVDVEISGEENGNGLNVTSSKHRLKLAPVVLGVSEFARQDCLPHLDVGDGEKVDAPLDAESSPARAALVDILSGRKILESKDGSYGPWSTRYCGHQFGQWAGQLGDGRAISVIETDSPAGRCEIQVKGAGRTPFSRQADGLAVLRSGVREYLGCEAVAALGIPSTRALAILTSPVVVIREEGPEPASLVARLAPTFVRIGHFEALNPGESGRNMRMIFLGGGWQGAQDKADPNDPLEGQGNLEALRELTTWVKDGVMGDKGSSVKDWFFDVVRRNAETVALWQAYGFMHGVLNTDNISIMGLTIDYGPYAFMDVFDMNHICNHSDPTGLYSYRNQPNRVLFALDSLASALLPELGYEAKNGRAPTEGWGAEATADDVRMWEEAGLEAIKGWNDVFNDTVEKTQREASMKRFGLKTHQDTDDRDILRDFLTLLNANSVDFGTAFRQLCFFSPSRVSEDGYVRAFARRWVAAAASSLPSDSISRAEEDIAGWLRVYAARATAEEEVAAWGGAGADWETERSEAMRAANPRFILRQWVLEEVIKKMEEALKQDNVPAARTALARVLDMCTNPFRPYGEDAEGNAVEGTGEEAERARLCGLGPSRMFGFQCSCSS